jgi:transposase
LVSLDLLNAPAGSRLDQSVLDDKSLTVVLATTTLSSACPLCAFDYSRVHSRYTRRFADLPCFGRAVQLHVAVRRFFCSELQCPRRIFAERLPGFAAPYARTTCLLRATHEALGCALGGEPGSRLSIRLAIAASPDTLLRRVKQLKDESKPPPRFVGIDDWAWRKGHRYGTIIVDLERGDVVDLLPDRDAETVKKWLENHPGVELISRDRSSTYAQAAAEGAPKAQQVADRWHLLKNLREAIERLLERQFNVVDKAIKVAETAANPPPSVPTSNHAVDVAPTVQSPSPQPLSDQTLESPTLQAQRARRKRKIERFEQVHERHRRGHSARRITRDLRMSSHTVARYLRCKALPDWKPGRAWRSRWDEHREWIDARIAEGDTNASQLYRQLTARGFHGSYNSVQRYVRRRLGATGRTRERVNAAGPSDPPPPSPRQLSFEWVRRPEDRKPNEQRRIDAIRASSDELASGFGLADEFAELLRKRSRGTLGDWLMKGETSTCPEIRRFAESIRRDEAAVLAAMTERWSNGPVEGHVNRLKMIKRQMYGRAGFRLLMARVVNAA